MDADAARALVEKIDDCAKRIRAAVESDPLMEEYAWFAAKQTVRSILEIFFSAADLDLWEQSAEWGVETALANRGELGG